SLGAYNVPMVITSGRVLVSFLCTLVTVAGACQSRPAASPPVSPEVWAVVDGREIRREEVEKAYRRTAPLNPATSGAEEATAKLNLLDQAIAQNILLAKANELKIVLAESELDAAFNDAKKNIPDEAFNKELSARQLTAADVREALRRDLLARKVIEQEATSKITVTDQDIENF